MSDALAIFRKHIATHDVHYQRLESDYRALFESYWEFKERYNIISRLPFAPRDTFLAACTLGVSSHFCSVVGDDPHKQVAEHHARLKRSSCGILTMHVSKAGVEGQSTRVADGKYHMAPKFLPRY